MLTWRTSRRSAAYERDAGVFGISMERHISGVDWRDGRFAVEHIRTDAVLWIVATRSAVRMVRRSGRIADGGATCEVDLRQ